MFVRTSGLLTLCLLSTATMCPLLAAQVAVVPEPDAKLDRPVDLELKDADFPTAIRALKASAGIVATVAGDMPAGTLTVAVRGVPAVHILDALAHAYGAHWRRQLTTVVFRRDPLAREVDLSLRDAPLPDAVKALRRAATIPVRLRGPVPSPKVTLALHSVPVRHALDVVAAIYGLRWSLQGGVAVLGEGAGPNSAADDAARERLASALSDVLAQTPGEQDGTLPALRERLMTSLNARVWNALGPGESLGFDELTPDEQDVARQIVQRQLAKDLTGVMAQTQMALIDPAGAAGSGISVRLTPDGRQLDLMVLRSIGYPTPLISRMKDGLPGPPQFFPP